MINVSRFFSFLRLDRTRTVCLACTELWDCIINGQGGGLRQWSLWNSLLCKIPQRREDKIIAGKGVHQDYYTKGHFEKGAGQLHR